MPADAIMRYMAQMLFVMFAYDILYFQSLLFFFYAMITVSFLCFLRFTLYVFTRFLYSALLLPRLFSAFAPAAMLPLLAARFMRRARQKEVRVVAALLPQRRRALPSIARALFAAEHARRC